MSLTMTKTKAAEIIRNTGGKIFSCQFVKKDGSVRKMVARLNTHLNLRGGESTTKHIPNLITCYDMQNQGYRNININNLLSLKANGEEYKVEGE